MEGEEALKAVAKELHNVAEGLRTALKAIDSLGAKGEAPFTHGEAYNLVSHLSQLLDVAWRGLNTCASAPHRSTAP